MGREKRKSRLDKGSAPRGDFVGFSQFAAPTTTLRASPVCTASDTQLGLVFKRITQKRDSVTKTKSLQELQAYFENEGVIRKNQVEALAHLVFVYHSKLAYDDAASVRAAAILCVKAASHRVPKAWNTLVEDLPEVNGMLWCAQADPTQEVRSAATPSFVSTSEGVILYVKRILGYDRPRIMHDALFARKQMDSDAEQDELDERYERIVGTALSGIELWIQRHPETDQDLYEGRIDDAILWKAFNSSKRCVGVMFVLFPLKSRIVHVLRSPIVLQSASEKDLCFARHTLPTCQITCVWSHWRIDTTQAVYHWSNL